MLHSLYNSQEKITIIQVILAIVCHLVSCATFSGIIWLFRTLLDQEVMFSITIAMMLIGTIVTFVSSIGHNNVTCNKMFRALGIVLIPSLQLYFSVLFAHIYVIIDAPHTEKLAICLIYPVFIIIGKEAMEKLDYDVFHKRHMIEFLSLILADLPYRFLYFVILDWFSGCILIAIKFMYKIIRYPVMTLNAEKM